jgi:multidrug transporter EmrE-like cation transporter
MTSATALLVVLAGVVLLGEPLSLRKGFGIALGLAAILLLAK